MKDIWQDFVHKFAWMYLLWRIVLECRCNKMICGGPLICCAVVYVKTRVICIHLFLHIHIKQFDKCAVWLNLIGAGVISHWNHICTEFTRTSLMEQMIQNLQFILIILALVIIDAIGSKKLVRAEEIVVLWTCRRIETDSNHMVYDILENFLPWGLELRSASCMLDLVSIISNVFLRFSPCISSIRM